jgi:hypothetical protein
LYGYVMPRLESVAPSASPQSLARREARNETILSAARLTLPGRMVLSCKRELDTVHAEAVAPGLDPAHRASLVGAAVKLREQLMDLLGTPKRPASSPGGKRQAVLVDVSPSGPTPADLDP